MTEHLRLPVRTLAEKRAAAAARKRAQRSRERAAKQENALAVPTRREVEAAIGPNAPTRSVAEHLRARYLEAIRGMSDEDLLNRKFAPALTVALKSQAIVDAKAKTEAKAGNAQLAFSIIAMLTGAPMPAPSLPDGNTVDGEFTEVDKGDAGE